VGDQESWALRPQHTSSSSLEERSYTPVVLPFASAFHTAWLKVGTGAIVANPGLYGRFKPLARGLAHMQRADNPREAVAGLKPVLNRILDVRERRVMPLCWCDATNLTPPRRSARYTPPFATAGPGPAGFLGPQTIPRDHEIGGDLTALTRQSRWQLHRAGGTSLQQESCSISLMSTRHEA
jgi:hypothetical protein